MTDQLKQWIEASDNIVFFGGAGVSTASGIPDFRSATGLYNQRTGSNHSPEYMLSHAFLEEDPQAFMDYLRKNLIFKDAKPNPVHTILADLEKQGKLKAVITQNIDGLHQAAGSQKVIELHGNLTDYYCTSCSAQADADLVIEAQGIYHCPHCGGFVRPDVVLYGESLNAGAIQAAVDAISKADVLIVGGTSLVVYPAAGMIQYYRGNKLVLINRDPTPFDNRADLVIHDDLVKTFQKIVN